MLFLIRVLFCWTFNVPIYFLKRVCLNYYVFFCIICVWFFTHGFLGDEFSVSSWVSIVTLLFLPQHEAGIMFSSYPLGSFPFCSDSCSFPVPTFIFTSHLISLSWFHSAVSCCPPVSTSPITSLCINSHAFLSVAGSTSVMLLSVRSRAQFCDDSG